MCAQLWPEGSAGRAQLPRWGDALLAMPAPCLTPGDVSFAQGFVKVRVSMEQMSELEPAELSPEAAPGQPVAPTVPGTNPT